jgi:hypothetical protein
MKLERFDPPGLLDDLDPGAREEWSRWISDSINAAHAGKPDENDGPRMQLYNPLTTDTDGDAQTRDIAWTAFPKIVETRSVSNAQRWRVADASRDVQDEYCEWSVQRDDRGRITRVTFTCEGPEYWSFLAATAPEKVVALYREHVSPEVRPEDLFGSDGYRPRNRWNATTTMGAMHLIQRANTLGAEIELAGGASLVRAVDGQVLTGEQELICCGGYGEAGRHSDPHIGERVNTLARARADVTLANPVGLYFNDLETAGWTAPDGSAPKSYWRYVRGVAGRAVRAVYEVPAERGFTVSDITINGKPIAFGAQIADFISIKLTGLACRFGKSAAAPVDGCRVRRGAAGLREVGVAAAIRGIARAR